MEKRFFDIFSRYKPTAEKADLLNRGHSAQFRYSKDPMRVEVELSFDSREDAELIYEIEDECRTLYNAESFKIFPHFPPESFNVGCLDEIVYEAALYGAVTHGFFTSAEYFDDGECITVYIPFGQSGIDFVKNANTEAFLANILLNRYGINRRFTVMEGEGAKIRSQEWQMKRQQMTFSGWTAQIIQHEMDHLDGILI